MGNLDMEKLKENRANLKFPDKFSDELIEAIKERGDEILNSILDEDNQGKGWICPCCGNGKGKKGDGITENRNKSGYFKCFSCGNSGDCFDWLTIVKDWDIQKDFREKIVPYCLETLHIDPNDYSKPIEKKLTKKIELATPPDMTIFYSTGDHLENTDYLSRRGLSIEVARKYKLAFVEEWRHPKALDTVPCSPRLIIPLDSGGYLARDTRKPENIPERAKAYIKQNVAPIGLFNSKDLRMPVFIIVEGAIDAMSIKMVNDVVGVVAINSISNKDLVVKQLRTINKKPKVAIICLDRE